MEWGPEMSVGRVEFDDAHKNMIVLLTRIHEALVERRIDDALTLAERLSSEAATHTGREETFLRDSGYPDVDMVVDAQRASLARIAELGKLLAADPVTADEAVLEMRLNFIDYLLQADINFKSFLLSEGLTDC